MMRKVILTDNNRIGATTLPQYAQDGLDFDFPEDFDFERQADWRIAEDMLVYDPLPEPDIVEAPDPRDAIIADLQQRVDEQDIALIELAGLITGGGA